MLLRTECAPALRCVMTPEVSALQGALTWRELCYQTVARGANGANAATCIKGCQPRPAATWEGTTGKTASHPGPSILQPALMRVYKNMVSRFVLPAAARHEEARSLPPALRAAAEWPQADRCCRLPGQGLPAGGSSFTASGACSRAPSWHLRGWGGVGGLLTTLPRLDLRRDQRLHHHTALTGVA